MTTRAQKKYDTLMGRAMLCLLIFGIIASFSGAFFMEGGISLNHLNTSVEDVFVAKVLLVISAPFGVLGITWFKMAFQKPVMQ